MFNDIVVNILKARDPLIEQHALFLFSLQHGLLFLSFFSLSHKPTLVVVFFLTLSLFFFFFFFWVFAVLLVSSSKSNKAHLNLIPTNQKTRATKRQTQKNKTYLNLISAHKTQTKSNI